MNSAVIAWWAGLAVSLGCGLLLIWKRFMRWSWRIPLPLLATFGIFWWVSIFYNLANGN